MPAIAFFVLLCANAGEAAASGESDIVSLLQHEVVLQQQNAKKAASESTAVLTKVPDNSGVTCGVAPGMIIMEEGACTAPAKDAPLLGSTKVHAIVEDTVKSTIDAGISADVETSAVKVVEGEADTSFIPRHIFALVVGVAISSLIGRMRRGAACVVSPHKAAVRGATPAARQRASPERVRALSEAVRAGDAALCTKLLAERAAEVNARDAWGCSPLHTAAAESAAACARALLEHGAQANIQDAWEEMPLHFAARAGSTEVCKALLDHGAVVNARNAQDWTPLLVAAHAGHEPVCKLLLAHGGNAGGVADDELPPLLVMLVAQQMVTGA